MDDSISGYRDKVADETEGDWRWMTASVDTATR